MSILATRHAARSATRSRLALAGAGLLLIAASTTAGAQLIGVKTVPIAEGEQFSFLPSANGGMGGVNIVLADSLLDPFINPAKGSFVRSSRVIGSPAFYSISDGAGSGRTLPMGGIRRTGNSFAGLVLALQEVDPAGAFVDPGFRLADVTTTSSVSIWPPPPAPAKPHTNRYAIALAGREIPDAGLSIGASVSWSGLRAVDGVDLLYPRSQGVEQSGSALDLRLGLTKELPGNQSLEAVLVHNRFRMAHDVSYVSWTWDPVTQQGFYLKRVEENLDRTYITGVHLEYERPLPDTGWRFGAVLTANRMTHPKIPNYEIMSIPRDPGYTSAFNAGVGFGRSQGPVTMGIDVVYEPIWSYTWAESDGAVRTTLGLPIPAGAKTVENHFRFSNVNVRAGVGRHIELASPERLLGLQLGVQIRNIEYTLDQDDHQRLLSRTQDERWLEWTHTLGASLRFPDLEVHYQWRSRGGVGRPGVAWGFAVPDVAVSSGSTFLPAPSGPVTLSPVRVRAHQFSIAVPIP